MDLSRRNQKNVISRWKKVHQTEKEYILKNKKQTTHFKARILGFIAGDGCILSKSNSKRYTVKFFPDHVSLVKSFEEAFIQVYNKKPKVKKLNNYYSIEINSKVVVEDLLKEGDFGKLEWGIPLSITRTRDKIEWLKAFFDSEGHVHKKYIRVQSVNGKGLIKIKTLLDELQIHSRIYSYTPKNKNWNKNYMLTIYRISDKQRYLDLIGFNHTAKLKKLDKILNKQAEVA